MRRLAVDVGGLDRAAGFEPLVERGEHGGSLVAGLGLANHGKLVAAAQNLHR